MNYADIREANRAINTLDDIMRCIPFFNGQTASARQMEIVFPFGGNSKREMTQEQAALVLRALYVDAAATLELLGVKP